MEAVSFIKMHGAGNDFVIIDSRIHDPKLTPIAIKNICDRHLGVGCDQLIVLRQSKKADLGITFYNSDGSVSAACGNGTRCCAALLLSELEKDECVIETDAGLRGCWIEDNGLIHVDMGKPKLNWQDIPLASHMPTDNLPLDIEGLSTPFAVSMGNPHAVFIVENIDDISVEKIGKYVENHEFFPERTNVEFVQIIDEKNIRLRVWERGSGLTLACGSGTCAAVVATVQKQKTQRDVSVCADGGTLHVRWHKDNHIVLSGPVAISFGGTLSESLWNG